MLSRLSLGLLAILTMLAFAPAAHSAEGDVFLKSCGTIAATPPCAGGVQNQTRSAAISPDGRMLVVGMWAVGQQNPDGALVYARNPDTGEITPQGCFSKAAFDGCTTLPQISYAFSPAFSPDGTSLYWPAISPDSLLVFTRDPTANTLAYSQCWGPQATCTPVVGTFGNIFGAVADNSTVYIRAGYAITVFTRTGAGTLAQKPSPSGCYVETAAAGCTDVAGVSGPGEIALTGSHLYITSESPGGFAVFTRAGDGTLVQPTPTAGGCVTSNGQSLPGSEIECVDGPDYLAPMTSATGVAASPDGKHVYIGGFNGLFGFNRDADTGLLTASECLVDAGSPPAGCEDTTGTSRVSDVELTSTGGDLIAATETGRLLFFTRAADGQLAQRPGAAGCMSKDGAEGCTALPGLGTLETGFALAANDRDLYAFSSQTGFVGWLQRDFRPICAPVSLDVPFDTSTAVSLGCSDFNGDDLTISIGAAPAKGTLGGVDQTNDTVTYTPFSGTTGSDSFTYLASARGIDSALASVGLNVLPFADADGDGSQDLEDCDDSNPAVAPGKPEIPDNGIDEDCDGADARTGSNPVPDIAAILARAWEPGEKFTRVKKLTVKRTPAETTVRVRCKGKGCRFKRKRVKAPNGGKVRLARFFNFRRDGRRIVSKLKPGTDVIIKVSATDFVGRKWAFEMRKDKRPSLSISPLG